MTSMTETPFYFVTPPVMLPDDVKKASERMMNLWMGAMSPFWAPFWAASSFGVGMWALARQMKPAEGLMDDMKSDAWLGLFKSWGLEAGELHEKAVEAVVQTTHKAEAASEAATERVVEAQTTAGDAVTEVAEVVQTGAEDASAATAEIAETAASDIADTMATAVAAAPEPVVTPEPPVQPKPIARSVSAQRKPKTKA
jgi:hypothetical protein